MTNQFEEVRQIFTNSSDDPRVTILGVIYTVLESVACYDFFDTLDNALTTAWSTELKGREMAESSEPLRRIRGLLIQADTHLLGAMIQTLQQSYAKSAWNLRKSWVHHQTARELLSTLREAPADSPDAAERLAKDLVEVQGWSDLGVGLFQLCLSFLPTTVSVAITWLGFSFDRKTGVDLLSQCAALSPEECFLSPIASFVLVIYYVALSDFVGTSLPEELDKAADLLKVAFRRFPGSLLFGWANSRLYRARAQLSQAIIEAERIITLAVGLPVLHDLLLYQAGFCALFSLDWRLAREFFDRLLQPVPDREGAPALGCSALNNTHNTSSADPSRLDRSGDPQLNELESFDSFAAFYSYLAALCCLLESEWLAVCVCMFVCLCVFLSFRWFPT